MDGCRLLKELPESIGQLTLLRHFSLSGCVSLNQLPESITQLTRLNHLKLNYCRNLKWLPERMGNMQGLITFDACHSGIEQLPDSFGELIKLVDLNLHWCINLTFLPDSIGKLMLLKALDVCRSKLKRLPKELGKMQSLERLHACCEQINELPDSIGQLSSLQVLNLSRCHNLRYLPGSIWNLTSLSSLQFPSSYREITNLPERVKSTQLERLELCCNIRLWLPKIQSFSSLKRLSITDESQSFSTEPLSLLKLSNLRHLSLHNHSGCGPSFYELPLNLQQLWVNDNATMEQLPDLSRLKCLRELVISACISLRSLPPLPPHLQSLEADECTKLQDVPDLSMLKELKELSFVKCSNLKSISLKESSLQARLLFSFRADLPNRMIPEWFNYTSRECKLSFQIPPALGDSFLGIALWVVYKCKETHILSHYRAVITNKTKATRKDVNIYVAERNGVELRSTVQCIRAKEMSVESGDQITVSIERILYCYKDAFKGKKVPSGEVEVETWGAHILLKTDISVL
ncbi:disease resistance protein TAO1-like [Daucus carota subsp. sativus]|uniref:disease resistance protein TAO1-like n=1 Tax=Daucus carota subsp. sativus TaxID=79200 RepID=UPI0007EFA650|nr:PREDICTED: disease resistance protein TAO1-like [Daucus carota subsp. sativus]